MSLIRTASATFYTLGAEIVCHPWNCGAASALQVYQHCSFGHAARRPDGELIKDLLFPTPPAEDVGNHDQGRPRTPLRTAGLRPRMMEEGLGESL